LEYCENKMEKFSIPLDAKVYVDALRSLIRSGANATASLEESALIDLPIVLTESGSDAKPARRAATFVGILERVISQQLNGNDRRAAFILFAFSDYAGLAQGDRYEAVAKLRGKRKWDFYRKEPLDRDLLMVYLALYREGEGARVSIAKEGGRVQSSHASRFLIDGGDYVTNVYEAIHNFPESPRKLWQSMQNREVTASSDGVDAWRQPSRIWGAKNSDKHPEVTLFGSGKLTIIYDQPSEQLAGPGRIYVTEVRFSEPLQKGQRIRFGLLKQWPVSFEQLTRKGRRDEASLIGITIPIQRATIGVRFPVNAKPKSVWHFEDLPPWLGSGVATEGNKIDIDSTDFASYTWNDLLVGYSYGIAWEW
jgi:hypothetical protein